MKDIHVCTSLDISGRYLSNSLMCSCGFFIPSSSTAFTCVLNKEGTNIVCRVQLSSKGVHTGNACKEVYKCTHRLSHDSHLSSTMHYLCFGILQ